MICCEQEEGHLPVPLIFQLCATFLFPIPPLPFALLPFPVLFLASLWSSDPFLSLPFSILNPHLTYVPFFLSIPLPAFISLVLPVLPCPPFLHLLGKKTI